jgi:hypothetical protein
MSIVMPRDVELRCRCGEVHGVVKDASAETVNRVVCYCDDCQAFAHRLGRADLLDANGGTDVVQVAPASLTFDRGEAKIVGLRLSPKGLYRWYASCCNTPLGNTVTPAIPFVGIVAQAFERPDEDFGRPIGAILGRFAIGEPPKGSVGLNVPLLARAIRKVLGWKVRGKTWPHPYFDRATKNPTRPISIVPRDDREALRELCGPRPTRTA